MKEDCFYVYVVPIVIGFIIGFLFALCVFEKAIKDLNILKQEAINHHYAKYDSQTGDWRWITQEENSGRAVD